MSSRRKLVLASIAVLAGASVLMGSLGYRSYRASCIAADQYVATANDGPWVRSSARLVLDVDPDGLMGRFAPRWVFRYRNPQTGTASGRVYVTVPGYRAFSYKGVLDPTPLLGVRP